MSFDIKRLRGCFFVKHILNEAYNERTLVGGIFYGKALIAQRCYYPFT
jgi:hypothetical protein